MSKQILSAAHLQLPAMRADYNQHSRIQSHCLQMFKPFIDSAVAAHSSQLTGDGKPFVVADFGCSTGLNSSDGVSHVIGEVRKKYSWDRCSSVLIVLNDLPRNPWSELFAFIHGDERSVMKQHQGVFAVTSGLSFYEQVLPDNSLQIGISSVSLHWCSQLPVKMKDHCYSMLASDEERELFRQQGATDWNSFLTARSKELVTGGVLAVNVLTSHETVDRIFDECYKAAKALNDRGVIDSKELVNFNMRIIPRSMEEVTNGSQYESLGLEILKAEQCPPSRLVYYEDFLQHEDVSRFAKEFSAAWAAGCETSFLGALSPDRSEEDKQGICKELTQEMSARISAQPDLFKSIGCFIFLVIRKK